MKTIDKIMNKITGCFGLVSALCLLGVVIMVTADVIMRKFGSSVKGAYEITERMLMVFVFAGLSYTETKKGHIYVTMLIATFPRAIRFLVFGLMQLGSTVVCGCAAYAAYAQTLVSLKSGTCTTVLMIKLYPFYAVECVCLVVFALSLLWACIRSFRAIGNEELSAEIQSSWS